MHRHQWHCHDQCFFDEVKRSKFFLFELPDLVAFVIGNCRIVRIKQQYGLIGIAVSTPFLLSIPVGVFLVVRYYRSSSTKFLYLIASNLLWSVIYTAFFMFWDGLLFKKG